MVRLFSLTCALAVAVVMSLAGVESCAQTAASWNAAQEGPALVKLSQPLYPLLATQAHMAGDAEILLTIGQDGVVESVMAVSGHPLFRQAALESAQQSRYECRSCRELVTSYRLVYTFQLLSGNCCTATDDSTNKNQQNQPYPVVTQSRNHVTVVDQLACECNPEQIKVRSVKCLYLWKCSIR
jgi:hypothetical protein